MTSASFISDASAATNVASSSAAASAVRICVASAVAICSGGDSRLSSLRLGKAARCSSMRASW